MAFRGLILLCGILAMGAGQAQGEVDMTTPASNVIVHNSVYSIDYDKDGTNDIRIDQWYEGIADSYGAMGMQHYGTPLPKGSVAAVGGGPLFVDAGETIDSSGRWIYFAALLSEVLAAPSPESGYVGIRFEKADGIHYGWVDMAVDGWVNNVTIRRWAYETEPGVAIITPEPSCLTLLALGGLALLRRKGR